MATGVRAHDDALALARAARQPAVRLVGVECYEDGRQRRRPTPTGGRNALMARLNALAAAIDAEHLFQGDEVLVAGGSALFDFAAAGLRSLRPAGARAAALRLLRPTITATR